jgi:predicted RNase H-like HicB family nuclease
MSILTVVYHQEDGSWWAESSDVPGFSAVGSTFEEVSQLVRETLEDVVGQPFDLVEEMDDGGLLVEVGPGARGVDEEAMSFEELRARLEAGQEASISPGPTPVLADHEGSPWQPGKLTITSTTFDTTTAASQTGSAVGHPVALTRVRRTNRRLAVLN